MKSSASSLSSLSSSALSALSSSSLSSSSLSSSSSLILGLALSLSDGTISSQSLVTSSLTKATSTHDGSVLHVVHDPSIEAAVAVDDERKKGTSLPLLAGIPVSIKDNFNVNGSKTTAGSNMLKDYVSVYDATVVKALKENRCIPCFKTNMDEFGMGSSMLNSAFGPCPNPWTKPGNRKSTPLTPGGSSGGSASVVSNGIVPVSIGSDTGGSVRLPASFCGLVGLKPTYGTLSRQGLVSYASSMDTPGIITKSVIDSALVYDSIACYDHDDPTSIETKDKKSATELILGSSTKGKTITPEDISRMIVRSNGAMSLKHVTVGVPKEFILEELNDDIRKAWQLSLDMLQDAGAKVVDVSMPLLRLAVPCYYVLACAEASSNLSRYDGIRYGFRYKEEDGKHDIELGALHKLIAKNRGLGFGPEVIKRILTGSFVLSESAYHQYFGNADRVRHGIRKEITELFSTHGVNMIACPTSPTLPYALNDPPDPCQMLLNDMFTVPANLTGVPAISIPINVSYSSQYDTNLPVGIQLIGPSLSESQLFIAALALEQRAEFYKHTPQWLM